MKDTATFASLAAAAVLAGCAAQPIGYGLQPGQATLADVEARLGPPAERRSHGGETWLYYPQQPYGMQNYVARVGGDGRLVAIEPRLTEQNLAAIERGKTSADSVRELLGPPYRVWNYPRMPRNVWEYRMQIAGAASTPQGLYVQMTPDGVVREVYLENDPDNRLSEGGGSTSP